MMSSVNTRVLQGFDDPSFGPMQWEQLLSRTDSDIVYMTWHWQRAWWEAYGTGGLLLITAERNGEVVALAPFYSDQGMIFFGSSQFESDYLDFVGDVSDPQVLDALLCAARDATPGFVGFRFFFVPDRFGNGHRLQQAARRLEFEFYEEDGDPAPLLNIENVPSYAASLANQKRLRKLERYFLRGGELHIQQFVQGQEVIPQLSEFFQQHISRWDGTRNPSRFLSQQVRRQFQRFTDLAANTGWLRFTRMEWQGRAIAFHYGLLYRGRYFWGPASFASDLSRYSPGMVLLRHLLLGAIRDRARVFDFGTGDAPFKVTFSNQIEHVHTWGLYPTGVAESANVLRELQTGADTSPGAVAQNCQQ